MTISCAVAAPSVPGIQIVKLTNGVDAANPGDLIVPFGSTVTWTYNITNIGTQILDNIYVYDDIEGVIANTGATILYVDESWIYTKTGTAISGQYSNTVTVTADPWLQGAPVSGTDTCYYTGEVPIPEFPTIAIPMLAIIGLAFVFTRRKE